MPQPDVPQPTFRPRHAPRLFRAGVLLAVLGFLAPACTTTREIRRTPERTELAADRVVLPTVAFSGFLFVEVRINGAGPFLLLVDTGANVLFLSSRVAEAARIRPGRGQPVEISGSVDKSAGRLVEVARLECGGMTLRGLTAAVVSEKSLDYMERYLGRKFDGAMGLTNFAEVVLELDFPNRLVAVARPGTAQLPADRAIRYSGFTPVVALDVAGRRVDCLVDTGANDTLALPELTGLPLMFPPEKTDGLGTTGVGLGNARHATSQLSGEAHLGPIVWRNPPVSTGPKGRIGRTALALWHVAFDQSQSTMYVLDEHPVAEWKRDFPENPRYKPGFFCSLEGRALRLLEVDRGFAFARAGLRVGDLVTQIDGTPAAEWLLAKHAGRLRPEALRAARFTVVREGRTLTLVVQLAPPPSG